ncbi:N-acetylmuramoyl-L-alanine amidase [uncultured Algibacter sp.]|uniref:N-acetylmuramoyl-L-alanine amidase n=1 Tax=uncultured Algibacter sp. TaxID=298659 RepID=UPI0032170A43
MKSIDYLIIQSTNTGEQKELDKADIIFQHTSPVRKGGLGWSRPGLDYLVLKEGTLQTIISEDNPTTVDLWDISQGKDGITGIAKHIAYVGGRTLKEAWSKDTRTEAQKATLEAIVKFYILRFPNVIVMGFDEIESKANSENPGFSTSDWLAEIGIPEQNIYKNYK